MAAIAKTSMTGSDQRTITVTTLGASDTFVFDPARNPQLILNNVSGGALTPLIIGADATTFPCDGIGNVDVSAGKLLVSIGTTVVEGVPLNSIDGYLKGVITVTGGDAMEAYILEF